MRTAARLVRTGEVEDRRAEERQTMVLRVAILRQGSVSSFCLVRNISPRGVQVRLYGPVEAGCDVELRIGDEQPLSGKVVWVDQQNAGIEFGADLERDALLRVTERLAPARRRASPRADASARAILRTAGRTYVGELRDISATGAKIDLGRSAEPGSAVMVTLPELPSVKAYVRWADGQYVGLAFETPLPMQIIAACLGRCVNVSG